MNNKINRPFIWRMFTLAFFMMCWIIVVFFMRLPFWAAALVFAVYLVINGFMFSSYVMGSLGNFYLALGRPDRGFKCLERAVKKNTNHVLALYNYAIETLKEGNAEDALRLLKKAEKLNTKIIMKKNITLAISSCYWVLNQIDDAIETLEGLKAGYEYVNAHVLTTLGYLYYLKEDYDLALEYSKKALDDDPCHAAAWDNLGQIYFKTEELVKAKDAFHKALLYKESLVDSLFHLGLIEEINNDFEKAGYYFAKANECNISALNTVSKEQVLEKYKLYH